METQILDIPGMQKSKIVGEKKEVTASRCCAPKNNTSVCCTLSQSEEDNDGACCAQPADGSPCCDK